jgi:L-ascorbate metabolism protein UlaG (beta-lactamase superfamily)
LLSACATVPAQVISAAPPDAAPIRLSPSSPAAAPLTVMRVAHATVLLDFDGTRVLTDPWFTESSQYHHGEPLGCSVAELPHLSAVLVSHGHYDHFDLAAFKAYPDKSVPMLVPVGLAARARRAGFVDVRELEPWQSVRIGPLRITAAPAAHGVAEITFVIEGKGRTVYFGGDTELIAALETELPRRFPEIDLALLPINGLRVFGHRLVMNAEQAAELASALHAKVVVPIHYAFRGGWFTDTFVLGYDGTPARLLSAARLKAPKTEVRILAPGQKLRLESGS